MYEILFQDCSGQAYSRFLDDMFSQNDSFLLVYSKSFGEYGYPASVERIKRELAPYCIKKRTDPRWPGTTEVQMKTAYEIRFYRTEERAKEILRGADSLWDFDGRRFPRDLAFFRGGQCRFYSAVHEKIAAMLCPEDPSYPTATTVRELTAKRAEFWQSCDEDLAGTPLSPETHPAEDGSDAVAVSSAGADPVRVLYFCPEDPCRGEIYDAFLDHAFARTDFFMLVYPKDPKDGFTDRQTEFRAALRPFLFRSRQTETASWPGSLFTYVPGMIYEVAFYRTDPRAKGFLRQKKSVAAWTGIPAQDMAFFRGNQCWFYSAAKADVAGIVRASDADIAFSEEYVLASGEDLFLPEDDSFSLFDEPLV